MVAKPLFVNIFSCSRVWYALSLLPFSTTCTRKLTTYMFKLFWNGSTERLKRSVMCNSFEHGGLQVIDIINKINSYYIIHIFHFLYGEYAKWHSFAEYWLGLSLRQYKASLWRNDTPHSFQPTQFYSDCVFCF